MASEVTIIPELKSLRAISAV